MIGIRSENKKVIKFNSLNSKQIIISFLTIIFPKCIEHIFLLFVIEDTINIKY